MYIFLVKQSVYAESMSTELAKRAVFQKCIVIVPPLLHSHPDQCLVTLGIGWALTTHTDVA